MTPIRRSPACSTSTGHPAASLPLHMSADGLPIGTMVVSRFGDEGALFNLAAQLEQAAPWAHRRPTIHVSNPRANP